jgi:hypothetical protein
MDLTRRYLFNGSAAAYGGRFVRPDDVLLATRGGSVLSIAGGRSVWRDRDIRIGRSFRLRSAETLAEGVVDSRRDAIRVTHGRLAGEALTATTTVSVRCRGLEVGGAPPLKKGDEPEPVMSVADLHASVVSHSASPGHEASVVVREAAISPVTFDSKVHGRFRLEVVTDVAPFKRADTRAKIICDRSITQAHGDHDLVFSTIVRELVWRGKPYPGSKLLGANGVHIPNLGRFFFGELIIQDSRRRLSLIRLELGSPTGGSGSVGDVDTNGAWSN